MSSQSDEGWRISPFWNAADEGDIRSDVQLVDCSLRDGEQQAGIVLTRDDKVEIARALIGAGIKEIEAGTPAVSGEDRAAVEEIVGLDASVKVSALARARDDEIAEVASTGAWAVRLSLPISDIQRSAKIRLSDDEYLELALRSVNVAADLGLAVIFSPFDTTRCDLTFLSRVLGALDDSRAVDRVRLVDTSGCATQGLMRYLVGIMRDACDLPIEVHCHDDFGMAVANTLAGALAGAEYLSVTVNGIGERAGNAALEEVAVALRVLYGVDTGIDTTALRSLSQLVAERSAVAMHRHKAVVGDGAFAHESGMVVAGVLADPFTAEPYAPELVGNRRRIVMGKKSGLASVLARATTDGVELSDEEAREVLDRVKSTSIAARAEVGDDVFDAIVRSVRDLAGGGSR